MVPADDEHKIANEAEKNTSTRGSFFEKLKFWKRCKQEDDKPARLTPMPPCLMKWWTPLLVAFILFSLSFICALGWGWQWHWPSSNAMKLCMTITGAGFAFSAWQQRSHDHATRELERITDAQREDYWKRREHIYQLLGSKNPGLRLSAVALLAELADTAAHSPLLNDTEKQQLQHHIIDTLCLQVRHEGLSQTDRDDQYEHSEIQRAIIEILLTRINKLDNDNHHANWSTYPINLTNCTIFTPIQITDTESSATLNFSDSRFHKPVTITDSVLSQIQWSTAHFHDSLTVSGQTNNCNIHIDNLPTSAPKISFSNSTIYLSTNDLHIELNNFEQETIAPEIILERCTIFTQNETKTPDWSTYQPFPELHISTNAKHVNTIHTPQNLFIKDCSFSNIDIISTNPETIVSISKCTIQRSLYITFEKVQEIHTNPNLQNNVQILIHQNTFTTPANAVPVHIANRSSTDIKTALIFTQNMILRNNDSNRINILYISTEATNSEPVHFIEETQHNQPVSSWKTGGPDAFLHLF